MTDLEKRYDDWRQTAHGRAVYDAALSMATRLNLRGRKHYSIRAIIYVIRYNYDLNPSRDNDGFKINNVFTPYLARELMATGKLPDRFFETREVKQELILVDSQRAFNL